MDRDLYIYPVVKQTVRAAAWTVAACAAAALLMLLLSFGPSDPGGIPVAETYCVVQYTASFLLLLLVPWCTQVLLAGRGSPLIRLYAYAAVLMFPAGLLLSGFQAPLTEWIRYYIHLVRGGVPFEDGYYLMASFRLAGLLQLGYTAIFALFAYRYTAGYPGRTLLLVWSIALIATAALDIALQTWGGIHPLLQDSGLFVALILSGTARILFWSATLWLACRLATRVIRISSMPEASGPSFGHKKRTDD